MCFHFCAGFHFIRFHSVSRFSFIPVWSSHHSRFIPISFWDGRIFIAVAGWGEGSDMGLSCRKFCIDFNQEIPNTSKCISDFAKETKSLLSHPRATPDHILKGLPEDAKQQRTLDGFTKKTPAFSTAGFLDYSVEQVVSEDMIRLRIVCVVRTACGLRPQSLNDNDIPHCTKMREILKRTEVVETHLRDKKGRSRSPPIRGLRKPMLRTFQLLGTTLMHPTISLTSGASDATNSLSRRLREIIQEKISPKFSCGGKQKNNVNGPGALEENASLLPLLEVLQRTWENMAATDNFADMKMPFTLGSITSITGIARPTILMAI
ncbi:hypothetical protein DFH09DRAFT_1090592 [Mycena vulgaris]|nr:hypothetical protein DFH09DRAFT_1090592 [Mycena vulgaris]